MFHKHNLLTDTEISSFCNQINMIIKAGFPIYYGVSILIDHAPDEFSRALYTKIYEPMEKGAGLYQAISTTEAFPEYMMQMVLVGEETGRLEEVLDSLTVYYEREAEIRSSIKQAVTYPLIMSGLMLVVLFVMITKVVPIFANVYAELGSGLTGSAKLLMNISSFINSNLLFLFLFVIVMVIVILLLIKTPFGKRFYEHRGLSLSLARSRFANCMYLALSSGLDTERGFSLAIDLIDNQFFKKRIAHCRELVHEGTSFSQALLSSQIFSLMYSSMITIGYKTSAMDDVMLSISKEYEKETDEKLQQFISTLEPTLIIILSFFIGLILVSFLLPLLGIMSNIG